jgi:hypothetical protein
MTAEPEPAGADESRRVRFSLAFFFAMLVVVAILAGLLVGFEPVGGDPDRLYRPLKAELARTLARGELPYWSDRFGLGVPLVAESQVAAFYPPNWLLYRIANVNAAYRCAMLVHYLAVAAATFAYGRRLGLTPWGSSLASVAFTFCGFQTIHSSHEPFYHAIAYLPATLWISEAYLEDGRVWRLALLALALGAALTLGHFQLQMWAAGLVLFVGFWRAVADRRPAARAFFLVPAVALGGAVAAVQLALSWDFAQAVGQTARAPERLAFYSFPPAHWIELALPQFFRGLQGGPEDRYWFAQQTTGYEAALYVGTVPLILSFVGWLDRRGNRLDPWRVIVVATFALATMPRWWPQGYFALLRVPALGYFRCPARYTLLTSLGLSLLAGQGLDRAISTRAFRAGFGLALAFGGAAVACALSWPFGADFHTQSGFAGLPFGVTPALVSWLVAISAVIGWRSDRVGAWGPCVVAAVELGLLYHTGTTQWGWAVALPSASPVLSRLQDEPGVGRVGGVLDDIPVRVGLNAATPYLGFTLPAPHPVLEQSARLWLTAADDPRWRRWLRRCGVTHMIVDRPIRTVDRDPSVAVRDAALDRLARREPGMPETRGWRVVTIPDPFPAARIAVGSRTVASWDALVELLSREDSVDQTVALREDAIGELGPSAARHARILDWNGKTGTIEHDGPCDLVLARTFDPGWLAQTGDGRTAAIRRVDGGFQAIRLPGAGRTRVGVFYRPRWLRVAMATSISAAGASMIVVIAAGLRALAARRARDEMFANSITNS